MVASASSFYMLCAACNIYDPELLDPPMADEYLLQPINVSHEVNFLPQSDELSVEERKRLLDFIEDIDPKDEGGVWIDAGGENGKARQVEVARALKHFGRSSVRSGTVSGRADNVIVIARRQIILPKACLDASAWPDPRLVPASCSNALNLVASVENRGDLSEGRELGLASGNTAAVALRRFWDKPYPDTDEVSSRVQGVSEPQN